MMGIKKEIDFFFSYFDEKHTVSFVSCIIIFRHELSISEDRNRILAIS